MSPSVFGDPDFKDLDLRQQLARAIYNCVWGVPPYSELALPAPVDSSPHSAPWLRAADECIRQMEWARREFPAPCTREHDCPGCPDCNDGTEKYPLTLAPEDWKP